jgi:WS/DGAT/MGAT family acyltransferase
MARERMSGVDHAWLRMDSPRNLMMIVGVWVLGQPLGEDEFGQRLRERLLQFDRFRQKVQPEATGAWWVDDDDFRLDRHLRSARLPAPGGEHELRALVGRLASRPLDARHPLWQFHLVEGYAGGTALVLRIHHCIADGVALVRVALSLTDDESEPVSDPLATAAHPAHAAHAAHAAALPDGETDRQESAGAPDDTEDPEHEDLHVVENLLGPLARGAVRAARAAGAALGASAELVGDEDARKGLLAALPKAAGDAMKIALMTEDSHTALKGRPGGRKRVAWNTPLPLPEVKAVCKVLGVSVNDVLLSCVAGALQRYLESQGERTQGEELRATVPVNLRPLDEPLSLGNRFGLVPLILPVGIANPIERLYEVRRRMNELKGGYQGPITFGVLAALGAAPRPAQKLVLDYLASKATAVMTNVPGPRMPIGILGRRIERMMFWVPQSGDIGLGVSILSYGPGVEFGVIADTRICPDPQLLIDEFQPEFERLLLTLSMLPRELVQAGLLDPAEVERRLFGAGSRRAPARRRQARSAPA